MLYFSKYSTIIQIVLHVFLFVPFYSVVLQIAKIGILISLMLLNYQFICIKRAICRGPS